MTKTTEKIRAIFLILCICALSVFFVSCSCGSGDASPSLGSAADAEEEAEETEKLADSAIEHETEFGGVYITMTIDDFNDLGFVYGDSVDIEFSNGYTLEDIPYYNGYYTKIGDPLLVAYPGYPYIRAGINNGDDLWEKAGLEDTDTATVTLNEAGKYFEIQNARDIHYEDEREKFPSDEAFANFRCLSGGDLKEDILYRSASPCDNQHNRAPYVDRLISEAGVNYILNLADSDVKIGIYITKDNFDSPYFLELYQNGRVCPLAMNMNFSSQVFREKVAAGFTAMIENEGPYLVHCTEGKDRTGFVCLLLEALAGASYQEIVDDYMITYDNYYEINEEEDKERYDVIVDKVLDPMIESLSDDEGFDIRTDDLSAAARGFLVSAGMTDEQIDMLLERITG